MIFTFFITVFNTSLASRDGVEQTFHNILLAHGQHYSGRERRFEHIGTWNEAVDIKVEGMLRAASTPYETASPRRISE